MAPTVKGSRIAATVHHGDQTRSSWRFRTQKSRTGVRTLRVERNWSRKSRSQGAELLTEGKVRVLERDKKGEGKLK